MKMPNFSGIVVLATSDLEATRARSAISVVGIGLGVGVLVLIAALGLGIRETVLTEVVRELPIGTIEVVPKSLDLGLFKTGNLFGDNAIDSAKVEQLRSIEGVVAVYPKLEVNIPMGARGGARFFGRRLYTDLFMIGLPEELVQPDAPLFADSEQVVPVVISDQLIEVFNSSVAPALGIPKLSSETLNGFEFEITIGRSLMLGSRGARSAGVERARIVGVSPYAMRLGVSVPTATARRLIAKYAAADAEDSFAAVLVRLHNAGDIPRVSEAVEALGLSVDETANRTRDVLTAAAALVSLVGVLVLLLAALNIAHSFFASLSERRRELAILRAVGARRIDLLALVMVQAIFLGGAGGLVGIVGARLTALMIDYGAQRWLPDFPFKPETFFVFPMSLEALGFVAAIVAAMLGALWPAWVAARAPVARALVDS